MNDELLALEMLYESSEASVPRGELLRFMDSDQPEVLGSLYAKLTKRAFTERIAPPMEFGDYKRLFLKFYGLCISNDYVEADNLQSFLIARYIAVVDFGRWFVSIVEDKKVARSDVADVMKWLENLYRQGDREIRDCLIVASLEHMFSSNSIRKLFLKWKFDPVLGHAYREALLSRGMKI
ncbi:MULTISPECIES: hypothetical protein [Burkholderia]|uniref:Uncharacterized protein n=1 Tax=Burkholderia aenigmatica TaxID=2015348 RepID=A0ABY6XTH8_9BURK|nr:MULTISPECIES: hypothetical protein [Burkholderia]VWC56624.1 hypothetical protein BLA17378_01657 [Burkholderia aenigmatica]VWC80454.1 hypothetical protein BLA18628_01163 [Burkholderia aenigmatica]